MSSVSFLAATVQVWFVGNYFSLADWHIHDSGGLAIYQNPQFFTFIINARGVIFRGRV
jgi:hypothetical protein